MKKRKVLRNQATVLIILLVLFFAVGCGQNGTTPPAQPDPAVQPEKTVQEDPAKQSDNAAQSEPGQEPNNGKDGPVKIAYRVYSETIRDEKDGGKLLNLRITYPEIANPNNDKAISAINEYYQIQFDDFISYVISLGQEVALEDKEFAQANGYEFRAHEYVRGFDVYYNGNNLLSVLHLQYEYTGGAHPNSFWHSETFDLKTGKKLALNDILGGSKEEALEKVYDLVLTQIKESEGTEKFVYFDNYEEELRKGYCEDDFVVTENSLMFYYQLYVLTHYAAGFPVFELPFEKAKDLAVKIPPLPSGQLERELYSQAALLIEWNKEVFYEIYGLSMLELDIPENPASDQTLYPVKDQRFSSFADLEGYIRNIYVKSEADSLLGDGRYCDVNGKLHGDISKALGMGYYVDWSNYIYELQDITANSATIIIYVTDDSPAGKENITITVKMQKENEIWLLEKMFS